MTRQVRFRQVDVKRALMAATAAGIKPSRVEIDPQGKIVLVLPNDVDYIPTTLVDRADREWAEWKAKYRGQAKQRRDKRSPQDTL